MTEEFAKGTTSFNNSSYAHIYVEKSKRPFVCIISNEFVGSPKTISKDHHG